MLIGNIWNMLLAHSFVFLFMSGRDEDGDPRVARGSVLGGTDFLSVSQKYVEYVIDTTHLSNFNV